MDLESNVAIKGSTVAAQALLAQRQGALYVFEKPASGWADENETAQLTATDASSEDFLGTGLAISADEATIVAGAPHSTNSIPSGAAYIYSKPATGWQSATQNSELFPPNPAHYFGDAVAINGPGTIVAIGAPFTLPKGSDAVGAAYVYRKPATGWAPTPQANARLNPPASAGRGDFGLGIAVRATTVVVGARAATVNGTTNQGAAYVFDRP